MGKATVSVLNGYRLGETVYESERTHIYRGVRKRDLLPVIIKLLKRESASGSSLLRLRQQYSITRDLAITGVVRALQLEHTPYGSALVLEDVGGVALRDLYRAWRNSPGSGQPFLLRVVALALQLADILERLHERNILHADLNPAHILIAPPDTTVYLIGFGKAVVPARQPIAGNRAVHAVASVGPVAQSERPARVPDYSADYNALGATLYELLASGASAAMPIALNDVADLAGIQTSAALLHPAAIPARLGAILRKLSARAPDERYQSAAALRADLLSCQHELGHSVEWPAAAQYNDAVRYQLDQPERAVSRHLIGERLSRAAHLMQDSELFEVAILNFQAAEQCRATNAYSAMWQYAAQAAALLPADAWQTRRASVLQIYDLAIEAACLSGNYGDVERLAAVVLGRARTPLERVTTICQLVHTRSARGQHVAAFLLAGDLLGELGVVLPLRIRAAQVRQEIEAAQRVLDSHAQEELLNLPRMQDARLLAAMRVLAAVLPSTWRISSRLHTLVTARLLQLTLAHGSAPESAVAYLCFGVYLLTSAGEFDRARHFGGLAHQLLEQMRQGAGRNRAEAAALALLEHWRQPYDHVVPRARQAFQHCSADGDYEYALLALETDLLVTVAHSQHLDADLKYIEGLESQADALPFGAATALVHLHQQVLLNLLGDVADPARLGGPAFDENALDRMPAGTHPSVVLALACQQIGLAVQFDTLDRAAALIRTAMRLMQQAPALVCRTQFEFYAALACTQLAERAAGRERARWLGHARHALKQLTAWAAYAPCNFQHMQFAVAAGLCRAQHRLAEAMPLYDQAIDAAREYGHARDEALMFELAGRAYAASGRDLIASAYLAQAYTCYDRIGAQAKLKHLAARYPTLLQQSAARANGPRGKTALDLDLQGVVRATQAIASEVKFDRLMTTLIRVLIELAGASRCVVLLLRDHDWRVEAVGIAGREIVVALPDCALAGSDLVPEPVIKDVARTHAMLLANDAASIARQDYGDYSGSHAIQSFVCLPIIKHNQLLGMFYLENTAVANAFQPHRIAVLQAFSGQVAVALENAYLYRDLQHSLGELRDAKARLEYEAYHDAITGLYNRRWLVQRLAALVGAPRAQFDPMRFAVLSIDLDRFTLVNDSLGHVIGDQLLEAVGLRLRELLTAVEGIVRIGSDEFVVLLETPEDVGSVIAIAEQIVARLRRPFMLDTYKIYSGAQVGIALSSPEHLLPEDILKDADVALIRARARGGGGIQLFDPAMRQEMQDDARLEYELRLALTNSTRPFEDFHLHYQPIISMATGQLIGYEALLRWRHRELGQVAPARFVPLAEEIGLIEPLSWWALREACRQLKEWRAIPGGEALVMQVNISPIVLMQVYFTARVAAIVREAGIPGQALKLEITESSTLDVQAVGLQSLAKLRAMGIRLCIDDFGTGYSSLSRLRELPIATIKIDRVFISRMSTRDDGLAIVEMIIALGEALKMDIVAEGVETTEQLLLLRNVGCELGQGFLFSSPLDPATAGSLIGKRLDLAQRQFVWQPVPSA